jgi:hypothetical protein
MEAIGGNSRVLGGHWRELEGPWRPLEVLECHDVGGRPAADVPRGQKRGVAVPDDECAAHSSSGGRSVGARTHSTAVTSRDEPGRAVRQDGRGGAASRPRLRNRRWTRDHSVTDSDGSRDTPAARDRAAARRVTVSRP